MGEFNGKFQYLDATGKSTQEGACRLQLDSQTLTLTPESGAALVFDLGDLNAVVAADWEIRLPLYTNRTILLRQFGKAYDNLAHDLLEAYRNRAVQCLLLEDLEEVGRFTGAFEFGAPGAAPAAQAEFRLYKSNLAVLPMAAQGFQWRLAEIDSVRFESANYVVTLESGGQTLKVSRLAKRTEEFGAKIKEAMDNVATRSAQALHAAFPFLNPDHLQSTALLMKEGRSVAVSKLKAIDPKIPAALAANAIDKDLKPYYETLLSRTLPDMLYAGFKLIRPEEDETADAGPESSGDSPDTDDAPDADGTGPQSLYWFFFPMAAKPGATQPANVVAWEASSRSGRATYFFRLLDPSQASQLRDPNAAAGAIEASIRRLNRVLAMFNFRRRPIYLSNDELELDARFHRYAIAARRLPEIRSVRESFLGRAIHSSVESWQTQVDAVVAKAGL